jgi:stage II sporulation protein P
MKAIIAFLAAITIIFIVTGMLTSLKPEYRITSSSLNEWAENFSGEVLINVIGFENRYFSQVLPEDAESPQVSTLLFEMATSINPDDPRSLLGRELPGFSSFDGEILVAGEGTNYTNMPFESAPPSEVLLKERKASEEKLAEMNKEDSQKPEPPQMTTGDKKVVYIYATHNRESYLPFLEDVTDPDEAYHSEANVTVLGERLSKELENLGIGSSIDKTDFTDILFGKDMKYSQSYDVARPVVQEAMANNKDIKYLIDIHRDSRRKQDTTVTINGQKYARTAFVVGGENAKYELNLKLATEIHDKLEEKFPGLSRGITTKQGEGTNGKFNQDLSGNALLIELGGVDNDSAELNRTVKAFAEVFADYYWDAEKVDAQ